MPQAVMHIEKNLAVIWKRKTEAVLTRSLTINWAGRRYQFMALLFAVTLFLSALLLFLVQPLIARMLLPYLGGSPAVWNTCMVFFQGTLLAGYAYSHLMPKWVGVGKHALIHVSLLILAFGFLPVGVSNLSTPQLTPDSNPSLWLLGALLATVGLPFFILSTNGPLLQRWFSATSHPSAQDPYFLYGASNTGSLLALVSYPLLLEPTLRLQQQSRLWALIYAAAVVLISACALVPGRRKMAESAGIRELALGNPEPAERISFTRRLRWIFLAFVPASLMLGATTYLSTDVSPVPLLWIIPLSIYLLSFILVFAKKSIVPLNLLGRYVLPGVGLALAYILVLDLNRPLWVLVITHLLFLFIAAVLCHGILAQVRPTARHVTEFYLWLSVGGVLGGLFNALLAPIIFDRILEYPALIILACLVRPTKAKEAASAFKRALDYALPLALLITISSLALWLGGSGRLSLFSFIVLPLAAFVAYGFVNRPVRFALAVGAILLGGGQVTTAGTKTIYIQRNFFGTLRVVRDRDNKFNYLLHGNTVHGRQFLNPERRCEPLSYYHPKGPAGDIYAVFEQRHPVGKVAVVGLGTGAMVAYSKPGQLWTFYEIDKDVLSVAQNQNYFGYLSNCARGEVRYVIGDARLRLREGSAGNYELMVLDAFSSDAIPVHLMTREAVNLYLSRLAPGGMLAFHISNRHLDLKPVLAAIARDEKLFCLKSRGSVTPDERANGKDPSEWIVMARQESDVLELANSSAWQAIGEGQERFLWTDDFSNIFKVFRW